MVLLQAILDTADTFKIFTPEFIALVFGFLTIMVTIIFHPGLAKIRTSIKNLGIDLHAEMVSNLNKLENQNKKEHDGIIGTINDISTSLDEHTKFIQQYTAEKETIVTLEFAIKDCLKYIDPESKIYEYIQMTGQTVVDMTKELIDIGIDNFEEHILLAKLRAVKARLFSTKKNSIDAEYIRTLKKYRENKRDSGKIVKDLLEVKSDFVNSKKERFRVVLESYMLNILRDVVVIWNKYEVENKKPN